MKDENVLISALKNNDNYNLKISNGDKWMRYSSGVWKVLKREQGSNHTIEMCSVSDDNLRFAVNMLLYE